MPRRSGSSEAKRRTDVVGVFPKPAAPLRLPAPSWSKLTKNGKSLPNPLPLRTLHGTTQREDREGGGQARTHDGIMRSLTRTVSRKLHHSAGRDRRPLMARETAAPPRNSQFAHKRPSAPVIHSAQPTSGRSPWKKLEIDEPATYGVPLFSEVGTVATLSVAACPRSTRCTRSGNRWACPTRSSRSLYPTRTRAWPLGAANPVREDVGRV